MGHRLLAHARRELPNESCALLAGDRAAGHVKAMHPARNLLASPYRYEVDPRDLVRIVHAIERRGDDLVAIFHSHPAGPPVPSAMDVREARYGVVHLLAGPSPDGAALRAWRIEGTNVFEVSVAISQLAAQSKALRRMSAPRPRGTR